MDDDDFFTPDEAFVQFFQSQQRPFSRRFRKADLLVLGLDFACDLSRAVTNGLATARDLAAGHVNHEVDRDRFHAEAAQEIESLIAGEDE